MLVVLQINWFETIHTKCLVFKQAEGETEVLVAGDPERKHIKKVEEDGGIHYHVNVITAMVCPLDDF